MTVRAATAVDVDAIRAVAVAAGERFRAVDDPRIARCADDLPMPADDVRAYVSAGRALTAVDGADRPVGFVVFEELDGCAHVEEVAVHPQVEGKGHGTALLDAVAQWTAERGLPGVTLTTFREVPWNAPFYKRRGFRVLADIELTEGLRTKVADEAAHGLDPELRVVMRRDLA